MANPYNCPNYPYLQPNQDITDNNGQMIVNHPTPLHQPASYINTQPIISVIPQNSLNGQLVSQNNLPAGAINNLASSATNQNNEWQTVNYKKRQRSPEENIKIQRQTKINDYWLSTPSTSNIYNNLQEEDEDKMDHSKTEKNESKPPPIFVSGVQNMNPLNKLLTEIAVDHYTLKALSENQVRIQPTSSEAYTTIVKALASKKTEFHTYQPKQNKPFKIVIKNIHYSIDPDEIKQNIEDLGHEVLNIWNVKQSITKKPLPMFFVDLKSKGNNKDIYNVKKLGHSIVTIEAPHARRNIPQCTKCQRFGHTKNFCHRAPRCVKCTGQHHTSECTRKAKDENVTCVNCGEKHPANYRGCIIHKQLQEKMHPKLRERNRTSKENRAVSQGITYAQVINQNNQQEGNTMYQQNNTSQPNDITELKTMMRELITQMGTIMNLITTLVSKMS